VLSQDADGVRYELIVVDNNSSDDTKKVIAAFLTRGYSNLRYVFEGKQGLANARNTGIAHARAPILSLTDDDVRVAKDWVRQIKRAFDEHPEVACIGGKILPRWNAETPTWLTQDHWVGALALQEYGEQPFYVNAENFRCLAGANLSFRREVFEQVGHFSPKMSVGADKSDLEMEVRMWQAGLQGLYVPEIVVVADVQLDRLTKEYHRKWHSVDGRFNPLMRLDELTGPDGQLLQQPRQGPTLFGVPAFMYRDLISTCKSWVSALAIRNENLSFRKELHLRYLFNNIRVRFKENRLSNKESSISECKKFATSLLRRKMAK
jgi:glycosyltransferase involved in cell wall biosynthesis